MLRDDHVTGYEAATALWALDRDTIQVGQSQCVSNGASTGKAVCMSKSAIVVLWVSLALMLL